MKTRRQSCTLVSAAAAVTILAGLLLGQGDPVRANEAAIRLNIARAKAIDRQEDELRHRQRQEFEQHFNEMIEALAQFSASYNQSQGNVWPAKEAAALDKAMKHLQSTRDWAQVAKR